MNLNFQSLASQATILIVDDTPANVGVLVDYLEDKDFRILVAQEGEEALMRAQLSQPDLILLDVMMPGIDGFETCRRLKAIESLRDIPVIFMTALTEIADKVKGFEIGGVDYVTKPFQIEEVFARVSTHLSLRLLQKKMTEQNQQLLREITVRESVENELVRRNNELTELNAKLSMAQEQLLQAEKLASIGQLAAGVAHEINNPIGYIYSNFATLENYIKDLFAIIHFYESSEQHIASTSIKIELTAIKEQKELAFLQEDIPELLQQSREGIERVRKIVQSLKDFSRIDSQQEWQWANLHQGIDSTLNIVNNEIKYKADVIKEYGKIPDVECLASQINQVVMNLVVNASHAITAERGQITIRTSCDDTNVFIEVADNGSGIPKEILNRIFDPFFTTKLIGKGTGLGLSLSYGIIQKHHGKITVNSEVGKGTSFLISLPIKHKDQFQDTDGDAT